MRRLIVAVLLSFFSLSVSATVIKTLDGVTYEWVELTATQGMSRDEVEPELVDPSSPLYGYEYASRALVESLLLSYTSFDGLNGYHGDPSVVSGMVTYFEDFGVLASNTGDGDDTYFNTVDGYRVKWDYFNRSYGFFGSESECGGPNQLCFTFTTLQYDAQGNATMVQQFDHYGWDSSVTPSYYLYSYSSDRIGSFLVRVAPADVAIDVDPWSSANEVKPASGDPIIVAVMGSNTATGDATDFDVSQINPDSLQLGVGLGLNVAVSPLYGDYNSDANTDAAFVFNTQDTGILCEETEVILRGQTFGGLPFEGTDAIATADCDTTGCHP